MSADIDMIAELARRARAVFEAYAAGNCETMFHGFPRGTCGPVTELLCRYLREHQGLDAFYVCGERDDGHTHAWGWVDGIIIDITADQFGEPAVIVARGSSWHAGWRTEKPTLPCVTQEQWPMYPTQAWSTLVTCMQLAISGSAAGSACTP